MLKNLAGVNNTNAACNDGELSRVMPRNSMVSSSSAPGFARLTNAVGSDRRLLAEAEQRSRRAPPASSLDDFMKGWDTPSVASPNLLSAFGGMENFLSGFVQSGLSDAYLAQVPLPRLQRPLSRDELLYLRNYTGSLAVTRLGPQAPHVLERQLDRLLHTMAHSVSVVQPAATTPVDSSSTWLREFDGPTSQQKQQNSSTTKPPPPQWAQEFNQLSLDDVDRFAEHLTQRAVHEQQQQSLSAAPSWANEFIGERSSSTQSSWASEFSEKKGAQWVREFTDEENWIKEFEGSSSTQWLDEFRQNSQSFSEKFKHYEFQPNNPYLQHPNPLQAGLEHFERGRLTEAILAFEAEVQRNNTTKGWSYLGQAHAENDEDDLAITSLVRAVEADPSDLDALIALGVSCTNDYYKEEALNLLETWIDNHPEYRHLATAAEEIPAAPSADAWVESFQHHRRITDLFLRAADLRKGGLPDPNVHTALGLLYNLTYEYDRAADSFRAALSARPSDYSLWNKLGATLANGNRTKESLDSYLRALSLKPSYVRAVVNLGIAHLALGEHMKAASNFLRALKMHPEAKHIWSNLEMVFRLMDRHDLVEKCSRRDAKLFDADVPPS